MYIFWCFLEINPLPHRAQCFGFATVCIFMHIFVSLLEMHFFAIQSREIQIVPSMTLHVSLYWVSEDETFTTESTVIWILPRMTFMCFFRWLLNLTTLPHKAHQYFIPLSEFLCVLFVGSRSFLCQFFWRGVSQLDLVKLGGGWQTRKPPCRMRWVCLVSNNKLLHLQQKQKEA